MFFNVTYLRTFSHFSPFYTYEKKTSKQIYMVKNYIIKKTTHRYFCSQKMRHSERGIRIPIKIYLKLLDPDPHEMNADPQPAEFVCGVDGLRGGITMSFRPTKFTQLFFLMFSLKESFLIILVKQNTFMDARYPSNYESINKGMFPSLTACKGPRVTSTSYWGEPPSPAINRFYIYL